MRYDLIIRHAQLHHHDGLVDIATKDGQFASIVANFLPTAARLVKSMPPLGWCCPLSSMHMFI